jgi:release factor glutamine methyltransferase
MTIGDCLTYGTKKLSKARIETARLDTLVLLEDTTSKSKAWILANLDTQLSDTETEKTKNLLTLRSDHTPLAYVRGWVEFYGRDFIVNEHVMVPRPESETMIDLLKSLLSDNVSKHDNDLIADKTYTIGDIGCGSGALGITAKLELPKHKVELIDIDPKALKIAKTNVDIFTLNLTTVKSDLLTSVDTCYDILLCNLPYVPDGFEVSPAVKHEPSIAIYGGKDGLNVYKKLFTQVLTFKQRPLYILSESFPTQHLLLGMIAAKSGYRPLNTDGFIQVFKLI